jgi:hypothetical protein
MEQQRRAGQKNQTRNTSVAGEREREDAPWKEEGSFPVQAPASPWLGRPSTMEYWKKTPREEEALLQDRQLLVSFIEKKWSDGHMYCLHLSLCSHYEECKVYVDR